MNLRFEALAHASNGLPVFPCDPNTKRPLVESEVEGEGGVKLATRDPAVISQWWSDRPNAMIGMRCGAIEDGGAGVFIVDLDPKGDDDRYQLLAKMCEKLAELKGVDADSYSLPPCPMTETPRGGLHLWFKCPDGLELKNRADLLKGFVSEVDVRANGGYVIIPPSVRRGLKASKEGCNGAAYQWAEDASLRDLRPPDAPPELLRLVTERDARGAGNAKETKPPAIRSAPLDPSLEEARQRLIDEYVQRAVDGELSKVRSAHEGSRNATLNNAALSLGHHVKSGRLPEGEVVRLLLAASEANGMIADDGVRSAELTIESAFRRADQDPPATYDHVGSRLGQRFRPPPIVEVPDYIQSASHPLSHPRAPVGLGEPLEGNCPIEENGGENKEPPGGPPPVLGDGQGGSDDGPPSDDPGMDLEKLRQCFELETNDTGNADRLRTWFGGEFLNVDVAQVATRGGGVHVFSGTHWDNRIGYPALQKFCQSTARRIKWEAQLFKYTEEELEKIEARRVVLRRKPRKKDRDAEELQIVEEGEIAVKNLRLRRQAREKFALSSGNGPRLNHMLAQALPHVNVLPELMDADPLLINVINGTLAIGKTHDPECPDENCDGACGREIPRVELLQHSRSDLITKCMPVSYDPEATAPKFLAFVERCQPKDENRAFLQRFHGLGLTGLTEQAFLLNYGRGANGKTTFIETIARLQGGYAQTLPAEALVGDQMRRGDQATPELARLAGARLVRAGELPRGQAFRESTLKMLTGGDAMPVRQLHGKFWDLQPIFKAVGTCNEKPDIIGVDEGIWRRVKLLEWSEVIPVNERRKIEDVLAEFDRERSGILNWLLAGLLDYLQRGLQVPQDVLNATDSYRDEMDPVGAFLGACVNRRPDGSGENVRSRSMYEAYMAFCHDNSLRVWSQKAFGSVLGLKGIKKVKDSGYKYLDVQLHDVPPDPEKTRRGPAIDGAPSPTR